MKPRSFLAGLAASAGMLVLILDARTALMSMRAGIEVCLNTLIPSLFPFFVLSIYLTGNLTGSGTALLRPVCRTLGIPPGTESLLLTGFLGGYPAGAQSVAQAYSEKRITHHTASRLLAFCSNAGPAFLFGVVGQAFDSARAGWMLWLIHIVSALLVGLIAKDSPVGENKRSVHAPISLPRALKTAIGVMAQVCGWVILFRTVLCYLDRWIGGLLPGWVSVLLSGILELSNGCLRLREIADEEFRFISASALTAFGGLCVLLQTRSVAANLPMGCYAAGKLLQTGFSILMAAAVVRRPLSPAIVVMVGLVCVILVRFLRKTEKNSSIPASIGV